MRKNIFLPILLFISECEMNINPSNALTQDYDQYFNSVMEIPLPPGFYRVVANDGSFAEWLRRISISEDKNVYLFDGSLKSNQSAQFAVLNLSIGKKDLQQCADAVMRLRGEFLFEKKEYEKIVFTDNNKKEYRWMGGSDRSGFEKYMENVFSWCGSASLEKQLNPVRDIQQIMPGDVFIKGGFPGHAMMVMDVAINKKDEKIFLLSQSFMPAQSIHIVKNPVDKKLNPWYSISNSGEINTPEYKFLHTHLRTW